MRGWLPRARLGFALLAGILFAASMPPRGWWPLTPVGVGLLAVALHGTWWRSRLVIGVLAGLGFFAPTLSWLTSFSAPGYVAVVVVEVALFALAVWLVPAGRGGWWALPAALVVLEAVRARFPLGGLPLPGIALGQVDGPFAATAGLGGSLLVVALVGTAGTGAAALLLSHRRVLALAACALVIGAALAISAVPTTRQEGGLRVALVQGGGPRGIPAVFSDPEAVTERQFTVSRSITGSPDLVLWPEDVVDVDWPVIETASGRRLAELARHLGSSLVAGVTEDTGARGVRNAAVAWGPRGRVVDSYEKVHRVPFGEYIPARPLFERLSDRTALVPRDTLAGRGPGLLATPAGPLGVVISFEVFFSDRARAAVNAGGRVLLVPTNAASYTSNEVPAMEVAAARLRAREVGRAVLQAAPTGYSAIIRPDGRVIDQSMLEAPALLTGSVQMRTGRTPYTRTGDWPIGTLALLVLASPVVLARLHGAPRPT